MPKGSLQYSVDFRVLGRLFVILWGSQRLASILTKSILQWMRTTFVLSPRRISVQYSAPRSCEYEGMWMDPDGSTRNSSYELLLGISKLIPSLQMGAPTPARIVISVIFSTAPFFLRTTGANSSAKDWQVRPMMAIPSGQHLRIQLLCLQGSATQNRPTYCGSSSSDSIWATQNPPSCSSSEGTSVLTWTMYPSGHWGKL